MAIGIVRIVLTLIPAFDDHVGSQIQYEAGTIAEVLVRTGEQIDAKDLLIVYGA